MHNSILIYRVYLFIKTHWRDTIFRRGDPATRPAFSTKISYFRHLVVYILIYFILNLYFVDLHCLAKCEFFFVSTFCLVFSSTLLNLLRVMDNFRLMKNSLITLLVLVSCVASINAQSSKQDSLLSLLQYNLFYF